jgi:ferredoxin--NADP+ reductase
MAGLTPERVLSVHHWNSSHLLPGPRLFLFGTGTGIAPFMSIIRDPYTYERFDQIILVHGVRYVSELAYRDYIQGDLNRIEGLEEEIARKLVYFPTVTREPFPDPHRITHLIESGPDLGISRPGSACQRNHG